MKQLLSEQTMNSRDCFTMRGVGTSRGLNEAKKIDKKKGEKIRK